MPLYRAFRQRLPDRHHVLGGLHGQFVVKLSKRLNARHRPAGIDEKQDSIERATADVKRLRRRHDGLAEVIVGHPPRLRPRNVQSLGEMLGEGLAIAGESGSL